MADTIHVASPSRVKARTRSTTGCWTCRVRRKKCDERSPECLTCVSLRLPCAGYGNRPVLMDGGGKEKQKAQEIKMEVNKQRKRGRQKSSSSCKSISEHSSCQFSDTASNSPGHSAAATTHQVQTDLGFFTMLPTPDESITHLGDVQSPTTVFSPELGNDHCRNEGVENGSFWNSLSCPTDWATSSNVPLDPVTSEGYTVDFDAMTMDTQQGIFTDSLVSSPNAPLTLAPAGSDASGIVCSGSPLRSDQPNDRHQRVDQGEGVPFELDLTYYCNHVISSAFPYADARLQSAFRAKMVVAHTQTALLHDSTLAHLTAVQNIGLARLGFLDAQSAESIAHCRPSTSFEQIKTSLQFPEGEDVRTATGQDTDIALAVLQMVLLQIQLGQTDCNNPCLLMEAVVNRNRSRGASSEPLNDFACSLITIADTLWTASMKRRPLLNINAAETAHFGQISARACGIATGCEAWVFQRIAEINLLRLWKHDCLISQALNVSQLVRRATKLEESTQEQESTALRRLHSRSISKDVYQITSVYASAIRVYLHVVVSGAHPEVSDIREAVEATVASIRLISHGKLVRRLAWPVCVAASLAEPRHDHFFKQLELGVQGDRDE